MENTALITLDQIKKDVLFSKAGEIDKALAIVRTELDKFKPDITTKEGREMIASMAYRVSRSKTFLGAVFIEYVAEARKKIKEANSIWKPAEEKLDKWRDETRKPLADFEAAETIAKVEAERLEKIKIQGRVDTLHKLNVNPPFFEIAALTDHDYGVILAEAEEAHELEQKRQATEALARKNEADHLAEEKAINEAKQKVLDDERKAFKAEKEADAEGLAEKERKQKAFQDKILADQKAAQDKIDADRKALEDEKNKERDRIAREAFEKQAKENARVAAEKAAKEKADREVREKIEAEEAEAVRLARVELLKSDLNKLYDYAGSLRTLIIPPVECKGATDILLWAVEEAILLAEQIEIKADNM